MQFNDTALTKSGILQHCEQLTGLGVGVGAGVDGGITGDATLKSLFTNWVNMAYSEVVMAIKSVDKHNTWDDFNYTDYPDAPITMVVSTNNNTIPVAASGGSVNTNIGIKGVYFLEADGSRTYLDQMSDDDTLTATNGTPSKYKIIGKSFFFNVRFSAACLTKYSSTFYVEFQRSPSYFVYTDTTKEPGFMSTYHDLLSLKASAWYLLPTNSQLSTQYEERFRTRLELLKRDIALFSEDTPRRLTPKVESCE